LDKEKIELLLLKARLLPQTPGVYKMIDKNGKVIYVGKSKSLKNRVSQYFQNTDSHNYKTRKMVEKVDTFECVFTDTETEALVLENELIKLFSPKFNIRLKDDKSYPYIKLSTSERYPRLTMVRSLKSIRNKNDKYFGPYSSTSSVYKIIDTVNAIFKLPTCKMKFPEDFGKKRPCLNYHINKCMGVCQGTVSQKEYNEVIKSAISFLKHDYENVIDELEKNMLQAAENLNFEQAAFNRDLISSIKNLRQKQKVLFDDRVERDVFGVFSDDISSSVSVNVVREGRIIDSERFLFTGDEIFDEIAFVSFLADYYLKREFCPKEVLIPKEYYSEELEDLRAFFCDRFEKNVKFIYPEKGELKKAVLMACENAKEYTLHLRNVEETTDEKLVELAQLIGLEVVPEHIEAYDVSNNGSDHVTTGMITIKKGKFSKKDYRLFNIPSCVQDDYFSMSEAMERRVKRYIEERAEKKVAEKWSLPDLILVDGGKGHVNAARQVLQKFNFEVPVFGMVKDEHHKTRTLVDTDREISIAHNMKIFNFIYGIQEEVHRFTFSSMDKKRRKSVSHLSIEKIKGIGPEKAKSLISAFKSVKALKEADVNEIMKVKGIGKKDAENIVKYFEKTK